MAGAVAARLEDGRLHLQHGPIDLIVEAYGAEPEIDAAYVQAIAVFEPVLTDLVAELPALRTPVGVAYPLFQGPVARRMAKAVYPHRETFVTPMAAVAGAVADHVLAAMVKDRGLQRAYVNNGGDIAVHMQPGATFTAGLVPVPDPAHAMTAPPPLRAHLSAADDIGGIATSGWRGRSLSLGIADAVTVLAATAAAADVAATLIANEVTVDLPGIVREPATAQDPDSDLGERLVTVAVPHLSGNAVRSALLKGVNTARGLVRAGLIDGAALLLQEQIETVGRIGRVNDSICRV